MSKNFDYVELCFEYPLNTDPSQTKRIIEDLSPKIPVVHLSHELHYAFPYERVRKAAIDEIKFGIDFASDIGASKVVIHVDWHPRYSIEDQITWQREGLKIICNYANSRGIKVLLEPAGKDWLNTIENIERIITGIENLAICFDIGHCNLFGRNIVEFIEKFGDKIEHVHVHDNFGGTEDLHLPVGMGKIKWKTVLSILKKYYNGTFTLEVFVEDEYILMSKRILQRIWESV